MPLQVDESRFSLGATRRNRPQRVIVYGAPGVGKTTFGLCFRNAVLIDAEHGADSIDAKSIGSPGSGRDLAEMLSWLILHGPKQGVGSVVIDSLDAIEPMIWREVCAENGKRSIESFAFGAGYAFAREKWRQLRDLCDEAVIAGLSVIWIGHAATITVDDPTGPSYTRRSLAMHKGAAADFIAWADSIFCLDWVREVEVEKQKKVGKASGEGRVIYTADRPGALAKTRRRLPPAINVGDDVAFGRFFAAWGEP